MAPPVGPRMPIYPPAAPGLGQQLFYGQGPPAILPPQVLCLDYYLVTSVILSQHLNLTNPDWLGLLQLYYVISGFLYMHLIS